MNCEECYGQCTCFIVAPCSYCESHFKCERCGEVTCNDYEDDALCSSCKSEMDEVAE